MKAQGTVGLSLAAAVVATFAHAAGADSAGDAVLAGMDAASRRMKTLSLEYEVVNEESGKEERKLALNVLVKGEKRLFEFVSPTDMKGTKVLIVSPTQMYVYLPAFGKVRRIASHTRDQGFIGLAFSQDDLAASAYVDQYTATVAAETPAEWRLVLTPRSGQATTYAKIEVIVGKDKSLPSELKYFNAAGTNIKTELRTGYTCEGDLCTPGELKMTDNGKGAWTKLIEKRRKVNQEIPDDVFSRRSLDK